MKIPELEWGKNAKSQQELPVDILGKNKNAKSKNKIAER
jgi:hypothetical protein